MSNVSGEGLGKSEKDQSEVVAHPILRERELDCQRTPVSNNH